MKFQVVVFGAIATVVVLGVDFYSEAKKAEETPGAFGLSGYVGSITGRWSGVQSANALEERQAQPARSHLPQTVEGWTRREWQDSDLDRFFPRQFAAQDESLEMMGGAEGSGLLAGLVADDRKKFLTRMKSTGWIYERGEEAVLLRATFARQKTNNSLSGQMMQVALGNMAAMTQVKGFAFVQGVGFVQSALLTVEDDAAAAGPDDLLSLTGRFGQGEEIVMAVDALARPESIRALLAEIDFDALNAMLTSPDPHIGSHVPEFDLEQQIQLAEMGAEDRLAALAGRSAEAESNAIDMVEERGSLSVAATEVAAQMGFGGGDGAPVQPKPAPAKWSCEIARGAKRCSVATD